MARLIRDARLETRDGRSKLPLRTSPFWRQIHLGLSVGYRRGKKNNIWIVRRLVDEKYEFEHLGIADDNADANGVNILSYAQAVNKALEFSNRKVINTDYTVREAAEDYIEFLKANKKSASQAGSSIRAHIVNYVDAKNNQKLGDRRIHSLTMTELERWKNHFLTAPIRQRGKLVPVSDDPDAVRKRKETANRNLTNLKALLNRAKANKKISDDSAWKDIKRFKGSDAARKVFLQPDQCRRAINKAKGAFRDYVRTLLYTGCRPGQEVEFIKVCDFDSDGSIWIPDGKTGSRHVFLNDEAVQFFKRLAAGRDPNEYLLLKDDGTPWGTNHHRRPMKQLVKDAKLPKDTVAYSLRHTFVSLVLKGGANIKVVSDQVGSSIKMLERNYAKFLNSDRRDIFNKSMPDFGYKPDNVETLTVSK